MPKRNDEPEKGAKQPTSKGKPGKDRIEDLDVDKEVGERVRGGRRMISPT